MLLYNIHSAQTFKSQWYILIEMEDKEFTFINLLIAKDDNRMVNVIYLIVHILVQHLWYNNNDW